jgi:hypothetical protein
METQSRALKEEVLTDSSLEFDFDLYEEVGTSQSGEVCSFWRRLKRCILSFTEEKNDAKLSTD